MQLAFLGQSYTASTPSIDALMIGETATVMGKPYVRKQYNVTQRNQPQSELAYRGIRYVA
jgi:predicted SpoU family rRNA methylase